VPRAEVVVAWNAISHVRTPFHIYSARRRMWVTVRHSVSVLMSGGPRWRSMHDVMRSAFRPARGAAGRKVRGAATGGIHNAARGVRLLLLLQRRRDGELHDDKSRDFNETRRVLHILTGLSLAR
jgi:hypothetical protein